MEESVSDLEPELPEVEPEAEDPQDEGWLFDAGRGYMTQMAYYKDYQGKPFGEQKVRDCAWCGESYAYKKWTEVGYCSKACRKRAYRHQKGKE